MKDLLRLKISGGAGVTLNILKRGGVPFYRAKCGKNCVSVSIEKKYFKAAEKVLSDAGRTFETEKRSGLLYFFKRFPLRLGVFLGLIAAIFAAQYYSKHVFSLELYSTETDVAEIAQVLSDAGVTFPSRAEDIDEKALELAILQNVKGASHATVEVAGTRLKVSVLSEFRHEPIIDMTTPAPIVATRDALITRIVCTSGTALVKVGDIVRAGEILIAPYIVAGEELTVPTAAHGEVYGEVLRQKNVILPLKTLKSVRTGKCETYAKIRLGALESNVPKPSFSEWESETKSVLIPSAIPVFVDYVTYYETVSEPSDAVYSEGFTEEIATGLAAFRAELPETSVIVNSYTRIKRLDNYTVLELYYQTEEFVYESKDG